MNGTTESPRRRRNGPTKVGYGSLELPVTDQLPRWQTKPQQVSSQKQPQPSQVQYDIGFGFIVSRKRISVLSLN